MKKVIDSHDRDSQMVGDSNSSILNDRGSLEFDEFFFSGKCLKKIED
jgi:hypothetical protein